LSQQWQRRESENQSGNCGATEKGHAVIPHLGAQGADGLPQ
jgi:hypothetical protein